MRRALLVAALALALVLDFSIVPLSLAIALPGGASVHGTGWLPRGLFFLLVATVLGWVTALVVTALRKPTS